MNRNDRKKLVDAIDTVLSALDNADFRAKLDTMQRAMHKQMVLFLTNLKTSMRTR